MDIFGDDDDGNSDGSRETFGGIPESIDGILFVDGELPDDRTTVALLDDLIQGGSGVRSGGGPSYVSVLDAIETEGIPLKSATLFFRKSYDGSGQNEGNSGDGASNDTEADGDASESEANGRGYAAMLVETDGVSDDVLEVLRTEIEDVEAIDHDDAPVYETGNQGKTEWIARLDDDMVVMGTEPAVRDSISTSVGRLNEFGGDLERAWRDASTGPITVTIGLEGGELSQAAGEISPELSLGLAFLPEIQTLTAVITEYGDEIPLELQLTMNSERDAESAEDAIQRIIDLEASDADGDEDEPLDERSIFDRIFVRQSGHHVVLEILMTPAEVVEYFDVYAQALASELGHDDALSLGPAPP